jgi:hypothetical protein
VLRAIYEHPNWPERTGLRRRLDQIPTSAGEGETPEESKAHWIAVFEILNLLGAITPNSFRTRSACTGGAMATASERGSSVSEGMSRSRRSGTVLLILQDPQKPCPLLVRVGHGHASGGRDDPPCI